ncbi:hypothetical protein SAMN02745226_01377 [Fervidobacterium gondwanense DSM 13020]|uniref:Uncharacterized protein n=2 Tax=Fervidobacteriaceae TaxID=1643950 RepID=A0A1M7SZ52_FERGO|nr:hypothetical protein SAMN02745226_01377 [Fervidobacterium gondwanense DSM 13020]
MKEMEIEKLIVSVMNEMTYYLLKNGAHLVSSEIVVSDKNFYVMLEANIKATDDVILELKKLSKIKDHPELRYYSSLATQVGSLQDIFAIAPYMKKFEIEAKVDSITLEMFVER